MKRKQKILIAAVLVLFIGMPLFVCIGKETVDTRAATGETSGTWIAVGDRWWYQHADGSYTTSNWEAIDGRWYYFDAEGWMVTGWLLLDEGWYYLSPETNSVFQKGECWTGWLKDGERWYYLCPSPTIVFKFGQMASGWVGVNGSWYFMSTGTNGTILHGQMLMGWITDGGMQYYLEENGVMQTGTVILEGIRYTFDSSGALLSQENVAAPGGGDRIAAVAMEAMDTPFVWGGTSLETGCDNEGFIYGILTSCGYTVPETLTGQTTMGSSVTRESLAPGDVVIYEGDRDLGAIYLGDNRVIYAASPRWGVRITNLEHPGEPVAYRRVW